MTLESQLKVKHFPLHHIHYSFLVTLYWSPQGKNMSSVVVQPKNYSFFKGFTFSTSFNPFWRTSFGFTVIFYTLYPTSHPTLTNFIQIFSFDPVVHADCVYEINLSDFGRKTLLKTCEINVKDVCSYKGTFTVVFLIL